MVLTFEKFKDEEYFKDAFRKRDGKYGPDCFICHKQVSEALWEDEPILYWSGDSDIAFHQKCANDFLLGFARDCHEMKQIAEKKGKSK